MAKIQEIELEGQKQIIEGVADLIDKMVRKGGKEAEKRLSNFKVTVNNVDFTIDDDNLQKQILDMTTEAHKSVVEGSKKIKKDLNMFLRNFEELNFGDDSMEIKMPDVKLDKKSLKGAKEETKEWAKILAMREKIFKNIDAYRNAKGSTDKDTLTPAYYNSIIQLKELLRLTDEYNSKYNKSKKIDFSGIGERTFNKEYNKILDNATDFDIDEDGSIVTQLSKMVDKMYDNAVNSAIKGNEKLQDQIQSYYRNIFSGLSRSVGGDVTNKEIEKVAGKIISDLENKNEELKKEVEKLTSENVNLKETNSSNDINSSEIQDKLAKTESELANIRTELSEKTGELAEKDSKIADITSELSEKDSKLVEAESELANIRTELSEKDTKLTKTESELANVRTELSEKDNKLTDSESEITNIRSQLANKDSELANKEKELNKVSEEVVKTNEKLEASYAELYEEKEKGRNLTIENDKNKEFNDKLSHSINELNIKYDSLEGKIKEITDTITRLKSELKGVSGEGFDNVKGSVKALDSQLMDLEHDFLSLGKTLQDRVDYLSFDVLETTVNNVVEKVDLLNTAIKEIGNGKKVDVSTFEKLGNEVDEIKSQMKDMFNASGIVNESDEVLQSLKKEGEQAQNTKNEIDMLVDILKNISTSDGIQAEINKLGELEDKLGNVITAVENKTKAFTNERNTVIDEVDKEIKKLKDLHEAVATISRTVNGMTFGEASLNSIDAFFTKLSESVDKFNATLSENTGADKFINSIKEITSKSNELHDLVKVMTVSEKKVKDTAKKLSVQTEAEEQIVSEKKLLAFRTKVRNMMNSELSVTRQFKDELSDLYKSLTTSRTVAEFEELETIFLHIKDQISKTGDANKTVLGLQDKLAKARKNTLGHTSEYSELLDRVEKKVKSISNGFSRLPDLTDKGVEKLRRDVLIAEELLSRANSDKFKQADLSAINRLRSNIKETLGGIVDSKGVEKEVARLNKILNSLDTPQSVRDLEKAQKAYKNTLASMKSARSIPDSARAIRKEIDSMLDSNDSKKTDEYRESLIRVDDEFNTLIEDFKNGVVSADSFAISLGRIKESLKSLSSDKYNIASFDDRSSLDMSIKEYLNKNQLGLTEGQSNALGKLRRELNDASTSMTIERYNEIVSSFKKIKFAISDTVAIVPEVKKLRGEIDKLIDMDDTDKTEEYKIKLLEIDDNLNQSIKDFDRGKISVDTFNASLEKTKTDLKSLKDDSYTLASIGDKNKTSNNIKDFINKNITNLKTEQVDELRGMINALSDDGLTKKGLLEISSDFEKIKLAMSDTVAMSPEVKKLQGEIDKLLNSDNTNKTKDYRTELSLAHGSLESLIRLFDKGELSVNYFNNRLGEIRDKIKGLDDDNYTLASIADKDKLSNNIKSFINKNAGGLADEQVSGLKELINMLSDDSLTKTGLDNISSSFEKMKFAISDTVAMSPEVKKLRGEIDRLINSDNTNKTQEYKNGLSSVDEELKDLIVSFDKGEKSSKEFNESLLGIRNKLSSLNSDEYIKESDSNRKKMANNIQSFINSNIGSIDESQLARLREIVAELNNLENEMTRSKFTSFSDTFDNIRYSISDTVANSPKVKKLKENIDGLISMDDINKTEEYKEELLNIKIELLQLIRDFDKGAVSVDRFNYSVSDMSSKLKTLNSDNAYNKASDRSRQSLANNILSFANRNITNIDSTQYNDLQRYATELNSLGSEVTVKRLEEINIEVNKIKASISSAVATSPEVKKLSKDISNLITANNTDKTEEYKNELVQLDAQLNKLISDFSEGKVDVEGFNNGLASIRGSLNALKTNKRDYTLVSDADRSKLYNEIDSYMKSNSKAAIAYRKEFEAMFSGINTSKILPDLDNVRDAYNKIRISAREANLEGMTLFDMISKRAKSMFATLISYISIFDIIRYVREVGVAVTQLDTAMTELKKVSDSTAGSLHKFYEESFNIADTVGTTAQQIINSTADWQRLGESLEEAKKSAQTSNVLLNVSEFENIDDATKSLVSMSQAYQELDKTDIVDKLNIIGNNFSISTDKLAEGLQRSAAALVTAGNDMDEAIALVTAGNSITQDADSVGAGLRTISLRIMGTEEAKEELASLGEETDDYVVQTKSKLQGLVKDYTAVASNNFKGFDILKDNGEYKSTYEILLGISKIYQEILETDEKAGTNRGRALLEALAGKNRANIAASILQNPDLLESVYNTSKKDYKGSAQHELDTYLDSVEGKLTQIRNEGQELSSDLLSSDEIKTALGLFKDLLDVTDNIVKNLGTIPLLIGTATGAMSLKDDIGLVHNKYNEYGNAVGLSFGSYSNKLTKDSFDEPQLEKYNKLLDDRNKKVITATEYEASYAQVMRESNLATQELIKSNQGVRIEEEQKAKAIKNSGSAAKVASVSMKALAVAGNLLAGAFVGLAIGAVVKVLDSLIITSKEAEESMGNLSSAVETMNSKHTSNIQTINSVKDRYYELSEGVNELGKNVSLTTDEYEEYKGIISQISDTMPQLTARYNEQGEKVGFLTGQIKDLNKELAEQEQLEYSKLLANGEDGQGENIDTILKGIAKDYNDTKSNVIYNNPISNLFKSAKNFIAGKGFQNDPYLSDDGGMTKKIQETRDEIDKLEQSVKNLEETGIPKIVNGDALTDDSTTNLQKQQEEIKKYNAELVTTRANLQKLYAQRQVDAQALSNLGKLYSKTNKEYVKLDEDQKSYIDSVLSNISPEEVDDLIEKAKDAGVTLDAYMSSYANNIVKLFSDNKNGVNSLMDKLLNFDFSDMSDLEIQQKVNELISKIASILNIDTNELKIRWGFEDVDQKANAMTAVINRMSRTDPNDSTTLDVEAKKRLEEWVNLNDVSEETLRTMMHNGAKATDSFKDLDKMLRKVQKDTEKLDGKEITIDAHVKTLDTAKTDLATLGESYSDYKSNKGTIDVNDLNSVSDSMKKINGSKKAYQEFLDVLTHMPEDTKAVQEAYNKLVTEYIDGTGILDNLTVANAEYTKSELEKMGIINAEEVVYSRLGLSATDAASQVELLEYAVSQLTDSTTKEEYASMDLSKASAETVAKLSTEKGINEDLRTSLIQLAAQKMNVNLTTLDTSGDISSIISLMEWAGAGVKSLKELQQAKANATAAKKMAKTKNAGDYYTQKYTYEYKQKQAQEEYDDFIDSLDNKTADYSPKIKPNTTHTPSSHSNSPKKTKAKKTKKTKKSMSLTKTLYNWIERKLDVVAKKADRAQERIDRLLDWDKKRNATLKALEAVEKQLDENYKASKRYYSYAKSQAKAEMKDAVAQVKKEGSKAQKKKYGKNLSQKTMDKYMNLVEEGKIGGEDIQAIKDPRIKAFVDAYIEWYEKAKAVDDTINSLTDDVRDLYEQLANNPLDKCAEQVEKLGNAMTVLEGKSTNATYKMNTAFVNMAKSVTKSTNLIGKTYYDMGTTLSDVIPNDVFNTIIENRDEKYKNLIATLNEYAIAAGNAMSNSASSVKKFETSQKQVLDLFSGKSAKDLGVTDEVYKSTKEQVANGELIDSDLITLFNKNTDVQNALREYLDAYIKNEAMQKALEKATSDYEIKNQEITTDIINNNLEALTKTDNYLQHQLDLFNAQESALAGQVALMEQYGKVYDRANYDKQIEIEQREYDAIIKARNQQMALLATIPEGTDQWYTDQWYEARDLINAYNDKLLECEGNMYSLKEEANSIADSLYEMYEVLNTRINNELQFFIDMMEEVEDFDPVTHMATDEGLARLYLYSAQMGNINSLIDQDKKKIIEYNEAIAKAEADGSERIKATIMGSVVDWTLSEAKDKVDEAYDSLMDHEKEFHALKNNMIEWEISKLEEELNLAQEIVDARKDALTAEKNLHDYQRSIQDATQNINNLQKQITVVRGDTSQEGKARVQALQKQLRDAQKNLEETEYERYISAEQEMLDNLMEEYTTLVDEEKTHREELYERAKLDIITNADKITSTIDTAVSELGVTPQYTSSVTEWLKDNKVTELSASLTTAIDNQRKSIIKALTGSEESDSSSSVFGSINGLSGKFDAFTTYKTDVDDTFKSLNTTMTSLQNKTFTAIVDTDTITNKIIAEIAKSKVVASNDEVIDVTANPEDPTNGGGTGSGGGNTSNSGSGKIFTNSTETPNGKINSTNGTHLPTQSAKTPEEVFNQIQAQEDADAKAKETAKQDMISKVWAFISGISRGDGLAKSLVDDDKKDFTGYGSLNQWVYAQTMDKKGKGLVLTTQGREALRLILGAKNDDEAFNKLYFDLGLKDPEWWKDDVSIIDKFMELNGKAKTKKKYTKANTYLYDHFNKVLSDENLRELTLLLGDTYDNASQSGNLYKLLEAALKGTSFSGGKIVSKKFAKGGIVDYVHGQGEDGIAMVRQGEGILTPAQTKTFMYELAPRIDDIIDASKLIKDTTANLDKVVPMGETNVEATFQFDLENVTNAGDIIKQIQTNNNVQKAIQSVTIDRIAGGSRLGVNKF